MSEVRFDASKAAPELLRRQSPYWGVHVARYQFAKPHVSNSLVLDIACGTGYGLPILLTQARSVVGVDLDYETISVGQSGGMLMVSACGTAVILQD